MGKIAVKEFRNNLKREIESFTFLCQYFRGVMKAMPDLSEDIVGDITVAIGQAELLMKERFAQFSHLIDDCELKRGEKQITCQDLQGFWDIVYIQVESVLKKFDELKRLESNEWMVTQKSEPPEEKRQPHVKKIENRKIAPPKQSRGNSDLRAMIQAARQKAKQDKINSKSEKESRFVVSLKPSNSSEEAQENIEIIRTPVKTKMPLQKLTTPSRSEVRVLASSLLKEQIHMSPVLHKDYSPCMRVTRSMKARINTRKLDLNQP